MSLALWHCLQRGLSKYGITLWRKAAARNCFNVHYHAKRNSHSVVTDVRRSEMHVKVMPALKNNYMYLIIDTATRVTAVVDPVDPDVVFEALDQENVHLSTVLVTHHHDDHSSGTEQLSSYCSKELEICAGDYRIPAVTKFLRDNEKLNIGSLSVHCLHTPCHTTGHFCFYVQAGAVAERALFSGDTLFQAGCGAFMEGTPEHMYDIVQRLCTLPDNTLVFGGHENTVLNLEYAGTVEPDNQMICKRLHWAENQRKQNLPTVPSTLGQEKCWNPFLRVDHPMIHKVTGSDDPVYAMYFLRKQRDHYKFDPCK